MLVAAATIATILLTGRLTALGIDDEAVLGQELVGNLYGRLQVTACIAAQVDAEALEAFLRQLGQGDEQFGVGVLAEVLDADIARLAVEHVGGGDALGGYLATGDGNAAHLRLAIAQDAQLDLGVLGTLQAVHGFLVGERLTRKGLVIDHDNLVASNDASTLGRTVADNLLHVERVLTDGELDAHAGERAAQVVVGLLHVLGRDIDGVGVQLGEYLGHSLLDEVVDIDRVHILVVDDVQQVVELVAAAVDDAQAIA